MREFIKVKSAGFCFGVKRAVKLALKIAEKYNNKPIYTLGPIIHNKDVVDELKNKGIQVAENSDIKNSVVILRSHGVEKNVFEKLEKNNNIIIDAICPFVKKIHDCVNLLKKEDFFLVIIGDKEHPEVRAISSYADNGKYIVVSNVDEIKNKKLNYKKIGIVAQTTQSLENFLNICNELLKNKSEFRIFNTICDSTSIRQQETIEVAKKVDIMIVIGGKHSANTTRLAQLSKKILKDTYHIENEKEIEENWFKNKKKVGITAGASTPDYVIEKVIKKIRGIK